MNKFDLVSGADYSAARRLLFRDSYFIESPSQIISWWEKRRLPFNIGVGAAGLFSLLGMAMANSLARGEFFAGPPLLAIIAYGVAANILYTSGWFIELMLRPVYGSRTGTVGAALFRYGLAFSVGLTLLPAGLSAVSLVGQLASRLL
ncbi:MAG: hypothetical protein ABI120_14890 [Gemmatimonadaceae bacterium]